MKVFGFEISRSTRASKIVGSQVLWNSGSNQNVTVDSAMQLTAVFGSVRILSTVLATLSLFLYRRLPDGGKEKAVDHPLYKLMRLEPHPFINSFNFIQMLQAHLALRGNAYSYIERNGKGVVLSLTPLNPNSMTIEVKNSVPIYNYYSQTGKVTYSADEILHIKAMVSNGFWGIDPISQLSNVLGGSQSLENQGTNFFENAAKPAGMLKYPGQLTEEALDRLRASWSKNYAGPQNSGKVVILEEGLDFQSIGVTNEQSQFLENRKFNKKDIAAAIFGVPPHMLGEESPSFSNLDETSQQFITYTMQPWMTCWERSLNATLLTTSEQDQYFFEFNADAFLRGDFLKRNNGLAIQRQNGVINADEWREIENRNPLPDGAGKIYLNPLNMATAGGNNPSGVKQPQDPGKPLAAPDGQNKDPSARTETIDLEHYRKFFRYEFERFVRRELKSNDITDFNNYLREHLPIVLSILPKECRTKIDHYGNDWDFVKLWSERTKLIPDKNVNLIVDAHIQNLFDNICMVNL